MENKPVRSSHVEEKSETENQKVSSMAALYQKLIEEGLRSEAVSPAATFLGQILHPRRADQNIQPMRRSFTATNAPLQASLDTPPMMFKMEMDTPPNLDSTARQQNQQQQKTRQQRNQVQQEAPLPEIDPSEILFPDEVTFAGNRERENEEAIQLGFKWLF